MVPSAEALLKDLDPGKLMDKVTKLVQSFQVPGIDVQSLVDSQKKNIEAVTSANRAVVEGLQAVAKRQAEILQETMNEASKAIDTLSKAGSPRDVAATQADLAKTAFERALSNMRELADLVNSANQTATNTINARISASLEEIKDLALKVKAEKLPATVA
ncbi:MAG: phasin family protein [Rhodospirillales bacterium]